MVARRFWIEQVENSWKKRNILWLSGVRRALEDPEAFLESHKSKRLVLDEVHRLQNPSEILKIAADHYPSIRILATGSSSLGASVRFRDTLAGRKQELWLTPMISDDLGYFNAPSLEHRLVRGGLPPFFMAKSNAEKECQEWLDAYWAKDTLLFFYELLNVTPPRRATRPRRSSRKRSATSSFSRTAGNASRLAFRARGVAPTAGRAWRRFARSSLT